MRLHLLDSYYYRALHNRLVCYLFDTHAKKFYQRLLRCIIFLFYLLTMCLVTIMIEACYYIHIVGRQARHGINPYLDLSREALDTTSFQRPCVTQRNTLITAVELLQTTFIYACISLVCGLFFAPTTTAMAIACMCINIVGCPIVFLHHTLIAWQYLIDRQHPITNRLSGYKVMQEMTTNQQGNSAYLAPEFGKHADTIEFLHDYVEPFAPTHLCPLIFCHSTNEYQNQLRAMHYPEYC